MKKDFDFDDIGKRTPYRTPDGFFEDVQRKVMERAGVKQLPTVSTFHYLLLHILKEIIRSAVRCLFTYIVKIKFFIHRPIYLRCILLFFLSHSGNSL